MTVSDSKRAREKRQNIVESAGEVMLQTGFKATTMESIAAHAGIAKGTLYAYFPDKDAIFEAILEELIERKTDAFTEAYATEGPVAARVGRGLAAKFGVIADLLEGSAFAHELINEQHRLASRMQAADTAIAEAIIDDLKAAGIADADRIVRILMLSGSGILSKFESAAEVRASVVFLCERLIGPDART